MMNFCPYCGKKWAGTPFCMHCGKDLSKFLDETSVAAPDVQDAPDADIFDFDALAAGAAQCAEAHELSAFEVEKHSNGKYAILGLKNKNELIVNIPDCVEAIADGAFENERLMEVTLPEGLLLIGKRAFANAKNLKKINMPKSLNVIDDEAFSGCEQLDLPIPKNTVRIGKDVFANTKNYSQNEGFDVKDGVLKKCTRVKEIMRIPKGITRIDSNAFLDDYFNGSRRYRGDLHHIEFLDEREMYVGALAFANCGSLNSICFHSQIVVINDGAFNHCYNMKRVDLSDCQNITIGARAFESCSGLLTVDLGRCQSISIGEEAFCHCSGLLTVDFGRCQSVAIGNNAFYCCHSLTHISLPARYKDRLSYIGIDPKRTQVTFY